MLCLAGLAVAIQVLLTSEILQDTSWNRGVVFDTRISLGVSLLQLGQLGCPSCAWYQLFLHSPFAARKGAPGDHQERAFDTGFFSICPLALTWRAWGHLGPFSEIESEALPLPPAGGNGPCHCGTAALFDARRARDDG